MSHVHSLHFVWLKIANLIFCSCIVLDETRNIAGTATKVISLLIYLTVCEELNP